MLLDSKFEQVCKVCGKDVHIGDRIWWIRGEKGVSHALCSKEGLAMVEATKESRATDADIEIPCPQGYSYLGFQKAGIAFATKRLGALIADEMGLGKTIQAIGVINADKFLRRVLVVCPASLRINWQNELRRWVVPASVCDVFPTNNIPTRGEVLYILIVSYNQLAKLPETDWDLLIVDEGHYLRNEKSLRTQRVKKLAKKCTRRLVLTGTPLDAKPLELWPILQIVAPGVWDPKGIVVKKVDGKMTRVAVGDGEGAGFWHFASRYCDAKSLSFGPKIRHWNLDGVSHATELQDKLRSTCMIRRLKSQVLTELPPKRRSVIVLPNEDYDERQDTEWGALLDIRPENWETIISNLRGKKVAFEEVSKVRHETALRKVPMAIEYINECLENEHKLIVFAHHHDVIDMLWENISESGVIDGRTNTKNRQERVERFQNGKTRVLIGSIGAMGTGFTLTAASHVIFVEHSWSPLDMLQCEDRPHRIGQRNAVNIDLLVLDNTIDARMAKVLVRKMNVADAVLNDKLMLEPSGNLRPVMVPPVQPEVSYHMRLLARMQLQYLNVRSAFQADDAYVGKLLAEVPELSARQAVFALKMLGKYDLRGINVLPE